MMRVPTFASLRDSLGDFLMSHLEGLENDPRVEARIPAELAFRRKWEIAFDLLDAA